MAITVVPVMRDGHILMKEDPTTITTTIHGTDVDPAVAADLISEDRSLWISRTTAISMRMNSATPVLTLRKGAIAASFRGLRTSITKTAG